MTCRDLGGRNEPKRKKGPVLYSDPFDRQTVVRRAFDDDLLARMSLR